MYIFRVIINDTKIEMKKKGQGNSQRMSEIARRESYLFMFE